MRVVAWPALALAAVGLAIFLTSLSEGPQRGADRAWVWIATTVLVAGSVAGIYYDLRRRR